MEVVEHSALLPYPAADIYKLVADIASYPDFLPWCRSVEIHEQSVKEVTASMTIAKGKIAKTITTRNILSPIDRMEMRLVDGPFKHFWANWSFQSLSDNATKVSLRMEFEFSSKTIAILLGPIFNQVTNTLVDSFCQRAHGLYSASYNEQ